MSRVIVLRQFAALRRRGDSSSEALARIEPTLPSGVVRQEVSAAARALATGGPIAPSALARVLSLPSGTDQQADALADALEARFQGEDATRAARAALRVALVVPIVSLALVGAIDVQRVVNDSLPPLTELVLGVGVVMRWLAVPLVALVLVVTRRRGAGLLTAAPGTFERAQRALELSTHVDPSAGVQQLSLAPTEAFLVGSAPTLADGLVRLAAELRRDAEHQLATFRLFAPLHFLVGALLFFGALVAALYLPIFSLAGAIK
ncbi:MAG: hypothetical protein ACOZQL_07660 [Myxococcota bacterium]